MATHIEDKNAPGKTTLLICLAFVLAQVAFFLGWIWVVYNGSGIEIRVELAPADPRDLLRGQYLTLEYAFDRSGSYRNPKPVGRPPAAGGDVYAALVRDHAGPNHIPLSYSASLDDLQASLRDAPGQGPRDGSMVILRGTANGVRFGAYAFNFGVNRYFVPEGSAEPPTRETEAVLLVPRNGKPRLLRLLVNGEPWTPRPRDGED